MADMQDVREIALSLADVVEIDSEGFDFRVAGKGFVWSYPERRPGRRRVIRTDVAVLTSGTRPRSRHCSRVSRPSSSRLRPTTAGRW
jgi:hypothetical protein